MNPSPIEPTDEEIIEVWVARMRWRRRKLEEQKRLNPLDPFSLLDVAIKKGLDALERLVRRFVDRVERWIEPKIRR